MNRSANMQDRSIFERRLVERAAEILKRCREPGLRIATAESCTGGLLAALLTEVPGCSVSFERGFVVYSNQAKTHMLGVSESLIDACGAVSEEVARAMVDGAFTHSSADLVVAITGIAGPDGGSADKPVGLVHFGYGRRMSPIRHTKKTFGDVGRAGVRLASLETALDLLEELLAEVDVAR